MTEKVRFFDGKKYMWDGEDHETEEQARAAQERYAAAGFEVQLWHEQGHSSLYTRRTVTEVVTDGS
jgi:hypothetical protein